jgi:hypothetical protein
LLAWVGYVEHDDACTIRPVASAGGPRSTSKRSRSVGATTPLGKGRVALPSAPARYTWSGTSAERARTSCGEMPPPVMGFGRPVHSHSKSTETSSEFSRCTPTSPAPSIRPRSPS